MAVYISLLEAGADFDIKIVSLKRNEQSTPEYAAINPKKKVPYLLIDDKGLTENVAIQTWIAETFPDAGLMPADSWDQKRALSYMGWFGSGCHPHITRHFKPVKFCTIADAHDDLKDRAKAMFMEQIELIDAELAGRTWFFDHYTVCDSYFFWIYTRALNEGFELSALKHCTAHNERMRTRESVQKVLAHLDS
jgi:glutathione S-transferase